MPKEFVLAGASVVLEQDSHVDSCYQVSTLELVGVRFPVRCLTTGRWVAASEALFSDAHLTTSVQLRLVRRAVRYFVELFELSPWWIGGITLAGLGVTFPF